jgi:hypothetical protein
MYGYRCEYCDGTVRPKRVERESFKHKNGFIILEDVIVCAHGALAPPFAFCTLPFDQSVISFDPYADPPGLSIECSLRA